MVEPGLHPLRKLFHILADQLSALSATNISGYAETVSVVMVLDLPATGQMPLISLHAEMVPHQRAVRTGTMPEQPQPLIEMHMAIRQLVVVAVVDREDLLVVEELGSGETGSTSPVLLIPAKNVNFSALQMIQVSSKPALTSRSMMTFLSRHLVRTSLNLSSHLRTHHLTTISSKTLNLHTTRFLRLYRNTPSQSLWVVVI